MANSYSPELLNSKVVILSTVKNCAVTVQADIEKLRSAFSLFNDVSFYLVESDSTDSTLEKFEELRQKVPSFNFISMGSLETIFPLRTERIAFCRNKYLDVLNNDPAYEGVEYCVVADLDNCQSLLTQEGVMSCFERDDWDACTSNQEGLYYDIWALRHPIWSPNDCWEQKYFLQKFNLTKEKSAFGAVFARMIEIPRDADWIEVDSSFGGLGIYRADLFRNSKYVGLTNNNLWGGQVCEHVAFHRSIKAQGGSIYINPKLINTSLNEHTLQIVIPEDLSGPIDKHIIAGVSPDVDPNISDSNESKENSLTKELESTKSGGSRQMEVLSMTEEDVIAAYKIFLKRIPETMDVVYPRVGMPSNLVLVDFLTSPEFLSRRGLDLLLAKCMEVIKKSSDANKLT